MLGMEVNNTYSFTENIRFEKWFNSWLETQDPKKIEEALITSLQSCPSPLDYPECMMLINLFRGFLSYKNKTVRSLAAKCIVKLVGSAITLAKLFFGNSPLAMEKVAKELLTILGKIGELLETNEIDMHINTYTDFKNVVLELHSMVSDSNKVLIEESLRRLFKNSRNKSDQFISCIVINQISFLKSRTV